MARFFQIKNQARKCILCVLWFVVMRHSKNMKCTSLVSKIEHTTTTCDIGERKKPGEKRAKGKYEHFMSKQGSHSNLKLFLIMYNKRGSMEIRQKYTISCYFRGKSSYIFSYRCQMCSSCITWIHYSQLETVG